MSSKLFRSINEKMKILDVNEQKIIEEKVLLICRPFFGVYIYIYRFASDVYGKVEDACT